jgi:hypothetical protein
MGKDKNEREKRTNLHLESLLISSQPRFGYAYEARALLGNRHSSTISTEHNKPSALTPDNIHEDTFVHMNDGTLRITVKWKPENYDELLDDQDKWNYKVTDLIHYLLSTATDSVIYPWKTAPGAAIAIPFIDLTPDNLPDYLGKRTLPLSLPKMFSFCLCLTAGPSKWLKNPHHEKKPGSPPCGAQHFKCVK